MITTPMARLFRPNEKTWSMDCRTALEFLEVVRDESDDLADASLAEAVAHVQSCPECEAVFQRRRQFDHRLAEAFNSVAVPSDLEARLLAAAVATAADGGLDDDVRHAAACTHCIVPQDAAIRAAQQPAERQATVSRPRTWIIAGYGAAACALVVLAAVTLLLSKSAAFTFHGLFEIYPVAVERLPAFDNSFPARLPDGVWDRGAIEVGPAKGFARDPDGGHQAAVFRIRFPAQRNSSATGILVVVPRRSVDLEGNDLPDHPDFGDVRYTTGSAPEQAALIWSSGDLVYVCFVPSDAEALRALERLVSGMAA